MNIRQPLLRLCTSGCGLLLIVSLLSAGISRSAQAAIPSDVKNSPDVTASLKLITATVTTEVADLGGDDLIKRGKARELLAGEVNAPGGQPFSGAFVDAYAKEVNAQLLPLATNPDPRVRLNVAIIVARVAEKSDNTRLLPITLVLLADKNDAVLNWALKAARFVLPPVVQAGMAQGQQQMLAAIKTLAKNPQLLQQAYEAMSLNYQGVKGNPPNWKKTVQAIMPEVLGVLQGRVAQFKQMTPPEAAAEGPAANFLVDPRVWPQETPAQQLEVVQTLSNLLSFAVHRAALETGANRDHLAVATRNTGLALGAAVYSAGDQALSRQLEGIFRNVDVGNPNTVKQIEDLFPKLKAVPAWGALKPPGKDRNVSRRRSNNERSGANHRNDTRSGEVVYAK